MVTARPTDQRGQTRWRLPETRSIAGHTFFPKWLRPGGIVIDAGAGLGQFTHRMLDEFDVECQAIEANCHLCRNMVPHPRLHVFNLALCGTDAPIPFHLAENYESSSLFRRTNRRLLRTVTVRGVRLDTFVRARQLETIDLLKVDIEGAEIMMFESTSDETLRRIKQVSVEFHEPQRLVSRRDRRRLERRLARLGFRRIRFSLNSWDVLFVNRVQCPLTTAQRLYFHYVVRARVGLRRARKWIQGSLTVRRLSPH
jgi:FkbM family methyltransferase